MPSGLGSPRRRPASLPDLGERSTFVVGQRVGRRRRRRSLPRLFRGLELLVLLAGGPLARGPGAEEPPPFPLVRAGRRRWSGEEGRLLGPSSEAVEPAVPVVSGLSEEE